MSNPVGYNKKTGKIIKCIVCGMCKYRSPCELIKGGKYCSISCSSKITGNGKYKKGVKQKPFSETTKLNMSKSHTGKKMSPEAVLKSVATRKKLYAQGVNCGENNYRWIKDRTKLKTYGDSEERRSPAYKFWRRQVCNRDKWKCRLFNNECNGRLEVHHILSFTKNPDLKLKINNGITLCHFHHPRRMEEEKRLIPVFQELVSVSKE